jgi:hypothetical protein
MKTSFVLAAMSALLVAPAAQAGNAAIEAPIHQMMDGFNKGDIKAAKATHVAAPTIMDEVAPYVWSGPNAFDNWASALTKAEAAEGKTGGKVGIGAPVRETIAGSHAYVVVPSTYTFQQKGRTMREVGTLTVILLKGKAGWKIQAWTWTSPEAAPAK